MNNFIHKIKRDLFLFSTGVQSSNFFSIDMTLDDQLYSFVQKRAAVPCNPSRLTMSHLKVGPLVYSSLGRTKVTYNVFLVLSV